MNFRIQADARARHPPAFHKPKVHIAQTKQTNIGAKKRGSHIYTKPNKATNQKPNYQSNHPRPRDTRHQRKQFRLKNHIEIIVILYPN